MDTASAALLKLMGAVRAFQDREPFQPSECVDANELSLEVHNAAVAYVHVLASLPAPAAPEEEKYHREVDVSLKNTAKEGSRDERCACGRPRSLHVVGGDGETYTCDGYIWPR